MTDAELDVLFERRFAYQKTYAATNMREIVALAQAYRIPLASHDDTTDENVTDAIRDRVSVAEFPTTIEAARGLHQAGIGILMLSLIHISRMARDVGCAGGFDAARHRHPRP